MGAQTKAAILVVDNDAEGLARLGQELKRRYGADYQVLEMGSSAEALDTLVALNRSEPAVAVVLAVQWMSPLTGTQLLGQVRALHPTAKRGLLLEFGNRSANEPLLEAMSLGAVDY